MRTNISPLAAVEDEDIKPDLALLCIGQSNMACRGLTRDFDTH